jgi:DNA-binding response OmpR family regulator
MEKVKILIVEDEDLIREELLEWFAASYEVVGARSVGEAESMLCDSHKGGKKFSLLLLDYNLPDGVSTKIAAAARRENPDIKVVYLTGRPDVVKQDTLYYKGDPVLGKPSSLRLIEGKIRQLLQPVP